MFRADSTRTGTRVPVASTFPRVNVAPAVIMMSSFDALAPPGKYVFQKARALYYTARNVTAASYMHTPYSNEAAKPIDVHTTTVVFRRRTSPPSLKKSRVRAIFLPTCNVFINTPSMYIFFVRSLDKLLLRYSRADKNSPPSP